MHRLIDPTRLNADHVLHAFAPLDTLGVADVSERLVRPLAAALDDPEVRVDIEISGTFDGRTWTARSGYLLGRFVAPLFGIAPTGRLAWLRFGCFQSTDETLLLLDLPSLMLQARVWPFAPPLGPDVMAPPPTIQAGDGAHSLAAVEAMIAGLMRYDGRSLASMGMRGHWTPDFTWYGPAPIGSFRGHTDYERGHQKPFLAAFPDRRGGNHRARIAQGGLVASTGWPSIRATHSGGDWLGLAPTGRGITMRVMDFWACRDGKLAENWVMIDVFDLLRQLDVDPLARMHTFVDRS